MSEGRRWLAEALAAAEGVDPAVLGKAHFAAGFAALGQGDYPQAKPLFEQALELARQAGDVKLEAMALQQIGWLVMTGGKYEEAHGERARELAGRALELARSIGDKLVQSGSLNILAELSAEEGDEATANELYEQSLTLRRELGDKRLIANSLLTLGRAELTRGDYEKATGAPPGGLRARRARSATRGACRSRSRTSAASRCATAATPPRRRSSSPTRSSSRRSAATSASPPSASRASAPSSASRGDGAQAARLFGACDALLEAIGATPTTIEVALNEQFIPSVKSSLGDERFTTEWVAGRAEQPEEAIEEALAVAGGDPGLVAA